MKCWFPSTRHVQIGVLALGPQILCQKRPKEPLITPLNMFLYPIRFPKWKWSSFILQPPPPFTITDITWCCSSISCRTWGRCRPFAGLVSSQASDIGGQVFPSESSNHGGISLGRILATKLATPSWPPAHCASCHQISYWCSRKLQNSNLPPVNPVN